MSIGFDTEGDIHIGSLFCKKRCEELPRGQQGPREEARLEARFEQQAEYYRELESQSPEL
eukprot:2439183-Prorocentrum_lima.AAC.1